jgi:hypothetical protein
VTGPQTGRPPYQPVTSGAADHPIKERIMAKDKIEDDAGLEGQSFLNPALTGSGTITPDGTYGPPEPDPTQVRGLGPDKTSGGRVVTGGGLGNADTERTGPSTSEDPTTRRQASSNRNR